MIAFSVLAFQVLKWQSSDISVSIVSENDEGNNEVTISILNTAGSTLLFYENDDIKGTIEYLGEDGWVEYCEVSYTRNNTNAISHQYGGIFAELDPGESWDISVPQEKIVGMKDGTYRIKMTYITEKRYNDYLNDAFENRSDDKSVPSFEISEESEDFESDVSVEISHDVMDDPHGSALRPVEGNMTVSKNESSTEEKFLASSLCEIFVKTFEYEAPDDFVEEFSINERNIKNETIASQRKIVIE